MQFHYLLKYYRRNVHDQMLGEVKRENVTSIRTLTLKFILADYKILFQLHSNMFISFPIKVDDVKAKNLIRTLTEESME